MRRIFSLETPARAASLRPLTMKRLSVLLLGALALFVNACEKHPASELPAEHATEFGKYLPGHGGEQHGADTHAPKADGGHAAPAPAAAHAPEAAKPAAEAKPGEAPKFFPEKK